MANKLKTIVITAVMETDFTFSCNVSKDLDLDGFTNEFTVFLDEYVAGRMEEDGGCWSWGQVQETGFDPDAIDHSKDVGTS